VMRIRSDTTLVTVDVGVQESPHTGVLPGTMTVSGRPDTGVVSGQT